MVLTQLSDLIIFLVALSIASERLVEIIKGLTPFLREKSENETAESWRVVALQLLAMASGVFTAHLTMPAAAEILPESWTSFPGILALGLLASGGSSLWNAVLGYVSSVKDAARLKVDTKKK
ncbi:MAG: hypothetical protein RRA94_10460 [Bacteroidota bacterium]|nr:hypothetical protein [Bacteroidota bacterium]